MPIVRCELFLAGCRLLGLKLVWFGSHKLKIFIIWVPICSYHDNECEFSILIPKNYLIKTGEVYLAFSSKIRTYYEATSTKIYVHEFTWKKFFLNGQINRFWEKLRKKIWLVYRTMKLPRITVHSANSCSNHKQAHQIKHQLLPVTHQVLLQNFIQTKFAIYLQHKL